MNLPHHSLAGRAAGLPYPGATSMPLPTQRLLLTAWLVATDALALGAALYLAYWIRFDLQVTIAPEVSPDLSQYLGLTLLLVPAWLLLLAAARLYDSRAKLGGIQELSRTFHTSTTATMLVIVATFLAPQLTISRMWLVSVWLISFVCVSVNRFLARRLVYALRRRGYLLSPALIVGTNEEAVSLEGYLSDWHASGVRTIGFVSVNGTTRARGSSAPILGDVSTIASIVAEHEVEDLIVAITALPREQLLALYEEVDPLPVRLRLSSGLYELLTTRVEVRNLGTVPLLSIQKIRLDPVEAAVKTLLEWSLALVTVIGLAPLLLALAIWVKVDSRGPVLHRRRVLGVFGRPFDAFKFRTMHVDGDARLERDPGAIAMLKRDHKLKDDPRVTRAGRWMRRFSLDELPQLFNVLLGQMALVGPRMITFEEGSKYGRQRLNLLTVKPGITGLWQVSGRSDLSYDERVRLDMYYVRNYSVWMDLQILFVQTIPAVVRGRGAY